MKVKAQKIVCPRAKLVVGKDISIEDTLEAEYIIWDFLGKQYLIPQEELDNAKRVIKQWYPDNQFKVKPPGIYFGYRIEPEPLEVRGVRVFIKDLKAP